MINAHFNEVKEKEKRLESYMLKKGLDGVILRKASNWAWVTGGRNDRIVFSSVDSEIDLIITNNLKKYCISANVETPRLEKEDLGDLGYETLFFPWYENEKKQEKINSFIKGKKFGSDSEILGTIALKEDFYALRYPLTDNEINKFKLLGDWSRQAVEEAARNIKEGSTEKEVAADVNCRLSKFGIFADVLMVGSDERIFNFRHPLTTNKKINKYAMILINGSKWGLCVALTRMVHFGMLPEEIRQKMNKVTEIEAKIAVICKPGKTMQDISTVLIKSYSDAGYPDEWKKHYQGGPIAYGVREYGYDWYPDSQMVFYDRQGFNWNPTITGTKSEDTFIVIDGKIEWITFKENGDWPVIEHNIKGEKILRPDILIK